MLTSQRSSSPMAVSALTWCTRHAAVRQQQRGISAMTIEWLFRFGSEAPDSKGATIRFFDKPARRRLERALGREPVRRFRDQLSCYLVEQDGHVITVGHRIKRVPRS